MTAPLLFLLAFLQGSQGPEVLVAVDRDQVVQGDVVTMTIQVLSTSTEPIRVDLPGLGGFGLESRSERSEVGTAGGRTTVITLKLRADQPGEWRLGPVTARQGGVLAQADAVVLTITAGATAPVAASLPERVARVIQRAPPPPALGEAGISVALSDAEAVVGQQVDVVTLAWFDRELRQRLRRAPTVEAPSVEGVWNYPQPVPGGIAGTRQVNGRSYDLFVVHQVVFPLTAGQVRVSPAHLQYSVPLTLRFFSQEERYRLESGVVALTVRPLPDRGRPPEYAGVVGQGLEIARTITPPAGRQGEMITAEFSLRGTGNLALWPPPDVRWPAGLRVYPDGAEERRAMSGGRLGGTKLFRFLLMPDSAGTFVLPPLRYPYFDAEAGRYAVATLPGQQLTVAPRGDLALSRAEPPPLRVGSGRPLARRLLLAVPGWGWWALVLVLPLLYLRPRRGARPAAGGEAPSESGDPLGRAERRLESVLRAFGRGMAAAEPGAAAARLRRAGVEPGLARRFEQLLLDVRAARYSGRTGVPVDAIVGRVEEVLRDLGARHPATRRWRRRAGLTALLVLAGRGGAAQTPPERLFEAGAYRAAEAGFLARARGEPDGTAHWYNLGDAAYRAGDDALALAAWTRAARLAPRDPGLRRARLLVAPADDAAAWALGIAPVTPEELWCLGLAAWLAGWAGIVAGRRLRGRWLVLLGGGVALGAAGGGLARWYRRPVAVVVANQPLRQSPHELAAGVGEVPRLGTVSLGPRRGAWVLADAAGGQRGWIRLQELVPVQDPPP